jgi:hypothetical protein
MTLECSGNGGGKGFINAMYNSKWLSALLKSCGTKNGAKEIVFLGADDEIALKKTYWEAYQQWPREIELKA